MLKRKLVAASLFSVSCATAQLMETVKLQKVLAESAKMWAAPTEINLIQWDDLGKCSIREAWSDFKTRTISLNRNCKWDKALIQVAVNHEYGHMLNSTATHSTNTHSVMYYRLHYRQVITEVDKVEHTSENKPIQ